MRTSGRALGLGLLAWLLLAGLAGTTGPAFATPPPSTQEATPSAPAGARTKLILLGTGTPNADPERWGPAVAVIVDDEAYLVDAGVGVVRRAAAAAKRGTLALAPTGLRRVFITHLHSDHTLGLPDLMLSPWVLGRSTPLEVYGPPGTAEMTRHIEEAWREDIAVRLYGLEPQSTRNYRAITHEIAAGPIYQDDKVQVDAIPVLHGSWPEVFGFRFRTPDRTIVISGDTRPADALAEACNGCDILLHEVYSAERLPARLPDWRAYHTAYHTSTVELARIAAKAQPKLLVLYHQLLWGASDEDLVHEIHAQGYGGQVISGRDLDEF